LKQIYRLSIILSQKKMEEIVVAIVAKMVVQI